MADMRELEDLRIYSNCQLKGNQYRVKNFICIVSRTEKTGVKQSCFEEEKRRWAKKFPQQKQKSRNNKSKLRVISF